MIIAGLTGDIQHGKSTFAEFLAAQTDRSVHLETWQFVAEVAEPLKDSALTPPPDDISSINRWLQPLPELLNKRMHATVASDSIALTEDRLRTHPEHYDKLVAYLGAVQVHPELATAPITLENKADFRHLLQWVGGYAVLASQGIWFNEIVRRLRHHEQKGIELATVGGVRYPDDARILRGAGARILEVVRPGFGRQDATDITERQRKDIVPDSTIYNNGSLSEFAATAEAVWHDLQAGRLASSYRASASGPQHE